MENIYTVDELLEQAQAEVATLKADNKVLTEETDRLRALVTRLEHQQNGNQISASFR